jgi:hypothetical protein
MAKTTNFQITDQDLERDMLAARTRGLLRRRAEPFAVRAQYDTEYQRIEVELSNGFWFAFPPSLFADLGKGDPEQLSDIEIDPSGYALHWAKLDSDYDIGGIVQVGLGAKKWLSVTELGRLGGKATSEAKRAAAIANGLKGGRPSSKKPGVKKKTKKVRVITRFKLEKTEKRQAEGRSKLAGKR